MRLYHIALCKLSAGLYENIKRYLYVIVAVLFYFNK